MPVLRQIFFLTFDVQAAVNMKIVIFWDVMLCSLINVHRSFDEICLLRLHLWKVIHVDKFHISTLRSLSTFSSPVLQLNSSAVHQQVSPLHSKNNVLILRFFDTINAAGFSPSPSCTCFHFRSLAEPRPLLSSGNWFFQRTLLIYLEYGGRRLIRNVNKFLPLHWATSHNIVFAMNLIRFRIFKLLKILYLGSWKESKLKISTGLNTCFITIALFITHSIRVVLRR